VRKNIRFCVLFFAIVALTSVAGFAQSGNDQPSAAPAVPAPQIGPQANQQKTPSDQDILKKEQSQRILGVVPQFSVTSRQDAPPLTKKQKFTLFVKTATDPFTFIAAGLQAGIGQASDSHAGYGQGAEGYGKRYGAALADSTTSNFFANFAYPVLFKADPRYFRKGEGTIKRRFAYSLEQEFVCHTDKGKRMFNFSNVLGAFTSGGISNAYYPPEDRGFELTVQNSAISLAWGSLGGLIDEFWPDIDRKLFHKKSKNTVSAPAQH